MSRPLKVYTHREYGNTYLPRDILDALGEPRHVRQGRLCVWAPTAVAAAQYLDDVELRVHSARDLSVASGTDVRLLVADRAWPEGTMLATNLGSNGPVIEITPNPDRSILGVPRTVRRIGELSYAAHFIPDEPVVTDDMVDTALEALQSSIPDGAPVGWLISNMRAAIAAALKAQRAEL